MNSHRYTLEPYSGMSSRYRCPGCNKGKTFSLYIGTETGEQLPDHVGRCNREVNCGYHYTPKQYFEDNGEGAGIKNKPFKPPESTRNQEIKPSSYIPADALKQSLKGYEKNYFIEYLLSLFGEDVTSQLIGRYFIGSSRHWEGATVFWQIDCQGKIRTGKIMLYSPSTGKRVKEPFNHITWVHKALKLPEFTLKQSFFGEHLLKDKSKPVAIVESEKTAIIASQYLPQFIWLAVGSLTNLSQQRCMALLNRDVVLFPDLNGFEKWKEKAQELSGLNSLTVSDLLERKATAEERKQGLDLADYLVNYDYTNFILPEPEQAQGTDDAFANSPVLKVPPIEWLGKGEKENALFEEDHSQSIIDNQNEVRQPFATNPAEKYKAPLTVTCSEIEELENFFTTSLLPSCPVKLDKATIILDAALFVHSHLATVKANHDRRSAKPYYDRLKLLKDIIIKSRNN